MGLLGRKYKRALDPVTCSGPKGCNLQLSLECLNDLYDSLGFGFVCLIDLALGTGKVI